MKTLTGQALDRLCYCSRCASPPVICSDDDDYWIECSNCKEAVMSDDAEPWSLDDAVFAWNFRQTSIKEA